MPGSGWRLSRLRRYPVRAENSASSENRSPYGLPALYWNLMLHGRA
jgi:hypothetical protein